MTRDLFHLRSAGAQTMKWLLAFLLVAAPVSAQVSNYQTTRATIDSRTIASNGGGTAATLTLTPTADVVAITCNDPDTCAITMGEPTIESGKAAQVVIVNVGSNAITFTDTSGVSELASGASLAQWESISLEYVTDRWVERARSTGSGTGAPTTADYLVKTANGTLSAERVVTDTTTVAWDWATASQAKANVPDGSISLAKMANLATDRLIGRDTAGTGVPEALTVGGGVEFTGSGGIQRSALTGDVTASAGSGATTIANDAVTYAKMQNVSAAARVLCRGSTAGSGDPEECTLGAGMTIAGTVINSVVTGSNGGDVVGPSSATDNAVARFDGATGKLIQNSNTTLSDTGAFAFADGVKQTFNPDGTNAGINVGAQAGDPSSLANGDLWYDSTNNTLDARINGATVSLGAASAAGTTLVEQHTASTSASLDFTSCISSTYDEYLFEFVKILPATDGALLWMRMATGGGPTIDTGANYTYRYLRQAGSTAIVSAGGATKIILTDAADDDVLWGISGQLRLFDPQSTSSRKTVVGQLMFEQTAAGGLEQDFPMGVYDSATAVTGVSFLMSSGNITSGTIRCYGVAK